MRVRIIPRKRWTFINSGLGGRLSPGSVARKRWPVILVRLVLLLCRGLACFGCWRGSGQSTGLDMRLIVLAALCHGLLCRQYQGHENEETTTDINAALHIHILLEDRGR